MKLFDLRRTGPRLARLLIVLLLLGAVGAPPAFAGETGEVVFRARVGDLGMSARHTQAGKSADDEVTVTLPGQIHQPPRELGLVDRDHASLRTPVDALQSDISAWKADDVDWIIGNFAVGDRAALKEFLADAEMRAANRQRFLSTTAIFVWATVRHGNYALVLFTHGQGEKRARGLVATFMTTGSGWRVTNALSADETLDLVWSTFRAGEMTAQP